MPHGLTRFVSVSSAPVPAVSDTSAVAENAVGAVTVSVAVSAPLVNMPPSHVNVKVTSPLAVGVTTSLPETALSLDHPSPAVQVVPVLAVQSSIAVSPSTMDVGVTESVTTAAFESSPPPPPPHAAAMTVMTEDMINRRVRLRE